MAKAIRTTKRPKSPPPPAPKRQGFDVFGPSAPPPDLVRDGKLFPH